MAIDDLFELYGQIEEVLRAKVQAKKAELESSIAHTQPAFEAYGEA